MGDEGYTLDITADRITIAAASAQGLIWGVQTLRQLLPLRIKRIESARQNWSVQAGRIVDSPRYEWRGVMIDVARHFFTVEEIEKFIDAMSYYKLNRLHLHLTDDQGWRLMIESWPRLALHGGQLEVGGTPGGYYTQADYRRIVQYAAARGVTIVPEIEMPGHSQAAISAYPELACEENDQPLYTGIAVGFSTFCFRTDLVYRFVEDVLEEVAALTPGDYVHVGADETYVLMRHHYEEFVPRVQEILARHGKRMVGWEEVGSTDLQQDAVAQFWDRPDRLASAVNRGLSIIMSPARLIYLDSKYNSRTPVGRTWTSEFLSVEKAYSWNPAKLAPTGARILGVEGPLWTETVRTYSELEYLAFPRSIGLAEIGWAHDARPWSDYRVRLGRQGPRLDAMGVNYYRSSEVPWW